MADYTYEQAHYAPDAGNGSSFTFSNMTNWVGAAVSVSLVIGTCVWGYRVMVRDVSGIPVVLAAEGPMRQQPDNPGGQLADNQGLAVNAVAGTSQAEEPAKRLVLAPVPAGLGEDDIALQDLPHNTSLAIAQTTPILPITGLSESLIGPRNIVAPMSVSASSETDVIDAPIDSIAALADRLAANATPFETADETEITDVVVVDDVQSDVVITHSNSLARSLRPLARPANARLRVASTAPLSAEVLAATQAAGQSSAPTVQDIDPASLPAGTRLVQIGAFPSASEARGEWDRVSGILGDYLVDKKRVVMRAKSGGKIFYRLRVQGFDDLATARRFCATFVEKNVDCIPVVTK